MIVSVKGNEQVTKMLNDWYIEIRARHVGKAHNLKLEIDQKYITSKKIKTYFYTMLF